MRGFISKLLDISHNHWLVMNLHRHHHTKGVKARDSKKNLLDKIEKQLDLGPENIPPDLIWMLEMNHTSLLSNNAQELQYWLLEVEAARAAGEGARRMTSRASSNWNQVLKDRKFCIPTRNTILDTPSRTEETKEITPPKKKKRRKELTEYQAIQKIGKGNARTVREGEMLLQKQINRPGP